MAVTDAGTVKRRNYTFRAHTSLGDLLKVSAEKAGRSVSEEIEFRLMMSFLADNLGLPVTLLIALTNGRSVSHGHD